MRTRFAILAVLFLASLASPSLACTCQDDVDQIVPGAAQSTRQMTHQERAERAKSEQEELNARRIAKAEIVVRGKVVSARAGEDVVLPSRPSVLAGAGSATLSSARVVAADFKVVSTAKGNVAEWITLYTGFGVGDCGIANGFLVAIAWDREVSFALQPISGVPNSYAVSICSYAEMHEPKPSQ
ncbi:MAG: hypothetical protein O9322_09735 [Beijerinckiaceae bacterium]|nr:hypothetical protein [Beijerinckiaceae bacterium]MCZ8299614.1 hypothetical protein [Beijerinckiaceae bacterium]